MEIKLGPLALGVWERVAARAPSDAAKAYAAATIPAYFDGDKLNNSEIVEDASRLFEYAREMFLEFKSVDTWAANEAPLSDIDVALGSIEERLRWTIKARSAGKPNLDGLIQRFTEKAYEYRRHRELFRRKRGRSTNLADFAFTLVMAQAFQYLIGENQDFQIRTSRIVLAPASRRRRHTERKSAETLTMTEPERKPFHNFVDGWRVVIDPGCPRYTSERFTVSEATLRRVNDYHRKYRKRPPRRPKGRSPEISI